MSRPPVKGELVVVALKAEKLDHKSPVKQDPFCIFRVGDIVKRTKTDVGGGLYPIWDDQVNIPVTSGQHQLFVQIFDKTTQPNNLMADGVIDLAKVFRDSEHDGYFPLLNKGRPGGVIYLELTFYSAINNTRPQQQVRYQHPPVGNFPPHQQQFRPQHRPPQQQPPPRPYPPQQPHYNYVPPPQQYNPQHTPQFQQQQPYAQHHRPLPQPPTHHRPPPPPPLQPQHYPPQMRPSNSMGTAQISSPSMPAPLLSAPYNPVPSPGVRPNQFPNPRQSYPTNGYQPPPAGFHDPSTTYPPQQPGFYPPQPQHPPHRPMPGYNNNNNNGYPPY